MNLSFSSLCDWFIDTKLSIHLCADKTQSILFKTKFNIEQPEPLLFMAGSKLSNNFLELPSGLESDTLDWGKRGLLTSILEKLSLFCSTSVITQVLLM